MIDDMRWLNKTKAEFITVATIRLAVLGTRTTAKERGESLAFWTPGRKTKSFHGGAEKCRYRRANSLGNMQKSGVIAKQSVRILEREGCFPKTQLAGKI